MCLMLLSHTGIGPSQSVERAERALLQVHSTDKSPPARRRGRHPDARQDVCCACDVGGLDAAASAARRSFQTDTCRARSLAAVADTSTSVVQLA
jgi:hypothetical protein